MRELGMFFRLLNNALLATVALCLMLAAPHDAAATGPDQRDFTPLSQVADYGGLLGSGATAQLLAQIQNLEYITKRQIVILTVPSLEGRAPQNYSDWIIHSWGIGQQAPGGALLLVAKAEKTAWLETVGTGMEFLNKPGVRDGIISSISTGLKQGNGQQSITAATGTMLSGLTGQGLPAMVTKHREWLQFAGLAFVIIVRLMFFPRRRGIGGMIFDGLLGGSRRRW